MKSPGIDKRLLIRSLGALLCLTLLCGSYYRFYHNENGSPEQSPDRHVGPLEAPSIAHIAPVSPEKAQLHVVIAHHEENGYHIGKWTNNLRQIPFMAELGIKVFIYSKGNWDASKIKQASGADEVTKLPNVGREGGTYLHHILSIYDNPPAYILVAQAVLKKAQQDREPYFAELQPWLFERLRDRFGPETGFMSLDRKHDICTCGHCTDMGRDDFYPLWPQLFALFENRVCHQRERHLLSFNGHFIVSRRRLLARPKWIYEYLRELVDAPPGHWIHQETEPHWFDGVKEEGPADPKFGHTLERLWHQLFGCGSEELVMDCEIGPDMQGPGGCSCRDEPVPGVNGTLLGLPG
ncbi:hypothetical protein MMC21_001552 [Puttea exsequens]|nr:hypothetical protein [Puttea exsequens]